MLSRERVLLSIKHKEPDRVPVDFGSTGSTGISAIAYNNLKNYLGIKKGHTKVYDVIQQLAEPEEFILDKFNIDIVDIGRVFNSKETDWYKIQFSDGSIGKYPIWFKPILMEDKSYNVYSKDGYLIARLPNGSHFFEQTYFPYKNGYPSNLKNLSKDLKKMIWSALPHNQWKKIEEPGFWNILRKEIIAFRKNTKYALMINVGCSMFAWGCYLRGMENFLMDLILNPKEVEKLLDALMHFYFFTLEKVCSSVGDIVDIIRFSDDFGMNSGSLISPKIYRKFFMPRHEMLCAYVKKHSKMHTFLHSCGSIYKLIPDFINVGFEIINPVQTSAAEMIPEKLKTEFGKDITFWGGGVDTQNFLNKVTPEEIKNQAKRRLEIFSPGGGFIFNTVHNILPDVPPENIVAIFEAIDEFYS